MGLILILFVQTAVHILFVVPVLDVNVVGEVQGT